MLLSTLLALAVVCSLAPAVLFCLNLRLYREPPEAPDGTAEIAVLIPARDEEANIEDCVRSVLASRGVALDVLVMDDGSTDRTAEIVERLAREDRRVHLLQSARLPPGWNGKQHACWQLAQSARTPLLLFLDADVRLAPSAIARMATFQQRSAAALVSGFPRQITVTFLEWLLLPLIHFVLLGFLPIAPMRRTVRPAFAAGCGQFLMVAREPYFASGGHAAIRETMHDGLRLPKLLRQHGYRTDLADLTALAEVRMYCSAGAVWRGLAKNATEGIAAPGRIVPLTLLLVLGQIMPVIPLLLFVVCLLTIFFTLRHHMYVVGVAAPMRVVWGIGGWAIALLASYLPRLLAVRRFRQPLKSAVLHPLGVLVLLALQWYALVRKLLGKPVGWRERWYASEPGATVKNNLRG